MGALYDFVWLLDGVVGIFLKIVFIIVALTYLSKQKGANIEKQSSH